MARARKKTAKKINVKIGKRHTRSHATKRRKRSRVGVTHHKRARKRKSKGFLGATGSSKLKQIGVMAIGVATGAGLTHIILRPIEKHASERWPKIGKFLAAGEVFLGGMVALNGKGDFMKSLGVGILAGGVHGLMKQANIYKEIPHLSGPMDEFTEVRVPISGTMDVDSIIAGILSDGRREVYTQTVSGLNNTKVVAGPDITSTETVPTPQGGDWGYYAKM